MLWLCLQFPELPLDAVRPDGFARDAAAVLTDGSLRNPRVVLANAAARAHGVRAGQTLAAAQALHAALAAWPRDAQAERARLALLADWAYRFSGTISLAPPRSLLVEIGASLTLFGGWPRLERRLREELGQWGLNWRLAAAPVAAGARVLAANRDGIVLMSDAQLMRELEDIPVVNCGLAKETSRSLTSMGLTRLGALFRLPRIELTRRIGPPALAHLDRLRGRLPEALVSYQPPSRYLRRIEFDHHISGMQALLFPLQRMLRDFATFLVARDGGVQRFELVLEHERGASMRIPVGLLAPQRDAAVLLELARARLERIALGAAVSAMSLCADDLPPVCPLHVDLFDDSRRGTLGWPALVERLRARLGDDALHRIAVVADHRPAHAWRAQAPAALRNGGAAAEPPAIAAGARPFWLLRREIPLGPAPAQILAGPERIESGWWDGDDQRRDYYIVRTHQGQRAWAYVAAGATQGWMLHGWFA